MTDLSQTASSARSRWQALVVLLVLEAALVVCWSAGFVGTRFAISHAPIFLVLLWRSLVSGLLLLPFALTIGPRMRWQDVRAHMVFATFGMAFYLASFPLAMAQGVPTGIVALVSDMLPLAIALLSWPILGQALTPKQWLGTAIGLAGVVVASGTSLTLGNVPPWSFALPVLGTFCLALSTLMQKRSPASAMPLHQSLCVQCLTAAAVFSGFAWSEGGVMPVLDPSFIGGILWLALVATFGAWSLYYIALRKSSPTRVTAVLYLSPPVTMIWAWLMFSEPLSIAMAVGLVVSLIGIVIVSRGTIPPGAP